MRLSTQARSILEGMARDRGVPQLTFDETGLIPVTVQRHQFALGFSESNNTFVVMGVVDVDCDGKPKNPSALLEYNAKLSPRRTRLALEEQSGALVMLGEFFLNGLEYWEFAKCLDVFATDFDEASDFWKDQKSGQPQNREEEDSLLNLSSSDMMVIRS